MRFLTVLFLTGMLFGHQQPTTLVELEVGSDRVSANLHVPLSELELAFGHGVNQDPERTVATWGGPLRAYLIAHIRPVSLDGRAWSVSVEDLTVGSTVQTQSGPFQEVTAQLVLKPPPGGDLRRFRLHYDMILHQVVSHKALVSVRSDLAGGRVEPAEVGVIAVNTATAQVEPFAVDLGDGSLGAGFQRMVALGIEHIRNGLDHLLFLIVLLLPATLVVRGREWGDFAGTDRSLWHLMKIVSAFTLGHSMTLIAGALHLVRLPQQPVEVLIAFSILVTAVHAVRPLFPGREAQVAAGFGLVHGLAFATVLADLHLAPGPMALSIFGFNLGIELMQLFVIALTVPWLILLSQTSAHRWVRCCGAVLAGVAAAGWMVNRITGEWIVIERWTVTATKFAPLGIVILALIAIPAFASREVGLEERGIQP